MDSDLKRRLVTVEQLHGLLEFMREHPELSRGLNRGLRGKLTTVKVWNACASKLNVMNEGAVKDGKGWSKYWCDWKYRVRRHALEIRVARETNKIPPEGLTPMSPIEETIMAILGDSSIDGVVVKSDPLEEDSNEEEEEENEDVVTNSNVDETRNRAVKRRREEPIVEITNQDDSDEDTEDDDDSGSPPAQRARTTVAEDSEEDSTTKFLRLEKIFLESVKKNQKSIGHISSEIDRLNNVLGEIREVMVKTMDHMF